MESDPIDFFALRKNPPAAASERQTHRQQRPVDRRPCAGGQAHPGDQQRIRVQASVRVEGRELGGAVARAVAWSNSGLYLLAYGLEGALLLGFRVVG